MTDDSNPPWPLIAAYLAGESTAADQAAVEAWVGDDLDRQKLVQQLSTSWEIATAPARPGFDASAIEQTVMTQVAEQRATRRLTIALPSERTQKAASTHTTSVPRLQAKV